MDAKLFTISVSSITINNNNNKRPVFPMSSFFLFVDLPRAPSARQNGISAKIQYILTHFISINHINAFNFDKFSLKSDETKKPAPSTPKTSP